MEKKTLKLFRYYIIFWGILAFTSWILLILNISFFKWINIQEKPLWIIIPIIIIMAPMFLVALFGEIFKSTENELELFNI
jgi:hypothetical protein